MRKRALFVLLLFLLLLGGGYGVYRALTPEPAAGPLPARPAPPAGVTEEVPGIIPSPPGGKEGSTEPAPSPAKGRQPGAESAGTEPGTERAPETGREESPAAPPAVRRNPRDPPPPDPKVRPLGNRPPIGPTGLWEKFPPAIPRGRAAIEVRVVDRAGVAVPGADVYLGPPDVRGQASVSYAHLRKLGVTDAEGRVKAERLPPGAAAVAANLTGLLNGPRGLDARTAVAVTLEDGRTVSAQVTLPFAMAEFGGIRGVVTGPGGKPVRNAQVFTGYFRVRSNREGGFEIRALPAGEHRLSITRSGYRPHGETVTVTAGEVADVEVQLEYRESGTLALAGTVTGPAGEPVPGAIVYLIVTGARSSGTIRSAETDEQGRYAMEALPDRLAKANVRVQASKMGYHSANVVLPDGLTSPALDLRLPVRLVRLKLTVVDSASGEPLDRCRFEARKPGEERPACSFTSRSETGLYETWIEAGTYTFLIEAPDHESLTVEVTVPAGAAEFPWLARLVGAREKAEEISLTVVVLSSVNDEPIEVAKVEVLDPGTGAALVRLEGRRPAGRFTLPAPTGRRRIRVSAEGYETAETDVDLTLKEPEKTIEVKLAPR